MVRVFGLERSGTNLLEWVIVNHFKSYYERIMVTQQEKGMRYYKKPQLLKHTLPTDKYESKNIVIYKPFEQWQESWDGKYLKKGKYVLGGDKGCTREVYDKYLQRAKEIDAFMIEYNDFVDNYYYFVLEISKYLGVDIDYIHPMPKKKMNTNMQPCE